MPNDRPPKCSWTFKGGGTGWLLAVDANIVLLRPSRGLEHTHALLAHPDNWIDVLSLFNGESRHFGFVNRHCEIARWDDDAVTRGLAFNVIDFRDAVTPEAISDIMRARSALMERIGDLRRAVAEGLCGFLQRNPETDLELAHEELGRLEAWINTNTRNGHSRKLFNEKRLAYNAVRRALERAFHDISGRPELTPMLKHLQAQIRYSKGAYCYCSDSSHTWQLT